MRSNPVLMKSAVSDTISNFSSFHKQNKTLIPIMLKIHNFKRLFYTLILEISPKHIYKKSPTSLLVKQIVLNPCRQLYSTPVINKYNKKSSTSNKYDTDDEDEDNVEKFQDERDSKVLKTKVNSLRADLLIKAGLNVARNKIENIFYESRIRVNGQKLHKKSLQLNEGDEIDVIRGFSQTNPSHLIVSRVILLSALEREDGYNVNLRRYKQMLIENYSGSNAYKSSTSPEHKLG